MNRNRLVTIGMTVMFAVATFAQQAAAQPDRSASDRTAKNEHGQGNANNGVPSVEEHLKVLTERLDLTANQQTKIKPILQRLHDSTQKAVQAQNISTEQRMDRVRASRLKADEKIREILNDDQKEKLDQLEQDTHVDLHGDVNGATPRSPQN